jgi:hypothetical protein
MCMPMASVIVPAMGCESLVAAVEGALRRQTVSHIVVACRSFDADDSAIVRAVVPRRTLSPVRERHDASA